jgi:hypothetical protein
LGLVDVKNRLDVGPRCVSSCIPAVAIQLAGVLGPVLCPLLCYPSAAPDVDFGWRHPFSVSLPRLGSFPASLWIFLPSWLPCSSVVGARATSPPFAVQSPQCPRERFPWWVHLVWFVQHAPSWPLDAPPAGTVVTPARKWHVLLVSPVLCLDNEQLLRAGVTRVKQGVHPGSSSLTVFSEFLHHA